MFELWQSSSATVKIMRYLAIDYGEKRTGLAICDANETIVTPLSVIQGQKGLLNKISDVVKREKVEAIVVGLPLNMDDSEGPQAQITLKFAEQLKKNIDSQLRRSGLPARSVSAKAGCEGRIPIHFQDERLSSFDAEGKLAPANLTRGKKKKRLDAVAAAAILEAFLEAKEAQ